MQKITPFLWFNDNAEEAVNLYVSLFKNSKIITAARYDEAGAKVSGRPKGSVMTVEFELEGQRFTGLNGGPIFKFTPAISFFVSCETPQEVDKLWKTLSEKGTVLMELAKYPFSEKYGWVNDRYGVSWQLFVGKSPQKIMPCLMFVGKQHGKAEEAMNFYTSLFKNSKIQFVARYEKGEDKPGVKHAKFSLNGYDFIAMDSGREHPFTFTEATSFLVNCETQQEIDSFWEKLSAGGETSQCGWLKDKYGISWQIVPTVLGKLFSDPKKSKKVMEAMLKMTKLDIQQLENAGK